MVAWSAIGAVGAADKALRGAPVVDGVGCVQKQRLSNLASWVRRSRQNVRCRSRHAFKCGLLRGAECLDAPRWIVLTTLKWVRELRGMRANVHKPGRADGEGRVGLEGKGETSRRREF